MKHLSNRFTSFFIILLLIVFILFNSFQTPKTIWLSSLDLKKMTQGNGRPVVDKNKNNKPLSIANQSFEKGVSTQVKSCIWIDLGGETDRFIASVGIDDDTTKLGTFSKLIYNTTHNFKIFGDGKEIWQSGPMNYGEPAKKVDLDVKRIRTLILLVVNSGKNDSYVQVDWANAHFIVSGRVPKAISPVVEKAVILTPKPSLAPRINGPKVYGCHPGNPFLYRVPVTGKRPMQFVAKNLPAGLKLNPGTGIITGTVAKRGEYKVILSAKNSLGSASRVFKIKCGDVLALTPPMGWNDWYAYYINVSDKNVREAADVFISSGMADAGYQYVNIDDCWTNEKSLNFFGQGKDTARVGSARDNKGNILPNSYFPDMKKLTSYIHSKGLKAGIYSSPGPTTCAGFTGSYQHEEQDARQFADWGFDFFKYDWCSYGAIPGYTTHGAVAGIKNTLEDYQKPYREMGSILKGLKRDIVFNLCQYGMGDVWKWGNKVGAQSWRTGGDLGGELNRLFEVALRNASFGAYCKPGEWNDPDYIQIGYLGHILHESKPSGFTPNEEYSFMSMWCLMAAPLFYSGDMNKLDAFTLNVLCNPEVIEIDQDPLGKCARVINKTDDSFIMVKELEDGSKAIGLCNITEIPVTIKLKWTDIGIAGKYTVRDLWRQKDLGSFTNEFTTIVPRHGTVMVRINKYNR